MPARPFSFVEEKFVAPIVCMECANNAYCIRREPQPDGQETQTFRCRECGRETVVQRAKEVSDEEVQNDAERMTGVGYAEYNAR